MPPLSRWTRIALFMAALLSFLLSSTCRRSSEAEPPRHDLAVFAAASLQDVLKDLAARYESQAPVRLVFNFAGSQDLARQIQSTHAADVFISTSVDWMDRIEAADLVAKGSRSTFLSNHLVVVANMDTPITLQAPEDLASAHFEILALGDPKAAPAGQYAKEWLEHLKVADSTVWDRIKDRVSPAPNVRSALAMVEAHGSAVGIVYRTDIVRAKKIKVLYEVPEASGPKIRYVAAAMAGRPTESDARRFVAFLSGPEARERLSKEGFVVPSQP